MYNILSIVFLILLANNSYTQSDCLNLTKRLREVNSRYSKLPVDVVQSAVDSTVSLILEDCGQAMLYKTILEGRLLKDHGNDELGEDKLRSAFDMATDLGDIVNQKQTLNLLSAIYGKREEHERKNEILDSAIQIKCHVDSLQCLKLNVRYYLNMGTSFLSSGKPEKAIEVYNKSYEMFQEYNLKDSIYMVAVFNGMGNIYDYSFKDIRASLNSYKKALSYCPHGHSSRFSLYNNIANRFSNLNMIDSARYYYNLTLDNTDKIRYRATPYQGLGNLYLKEGNISAAIETYETAIANAIEYGNENYIYVSKALYGKALFLNGEYRKAKSQFDSVLLHYQSTSTVASESVDLENWALINEVAIYNKEIAQRLYHNTEFRDSLNQEQRISYLNNSLARFEQRITQDSLAYLKLYKENSDIKTSKYKISIVALALGLVMFLLLVLRIIKAYKVQRDKSSYLLFENKELAGLNANLQSRINELNSIKSNEGNISNRSKLKFKHLDKTIILDFEDVHYVKAEEDGCRIQDGSKSYWTKMTLTSFETLLPSSLFFRIHRGTIVNILHLEWLNHSSLKLKDGTELRIGRTYKDSIRNAVIKD